MATNPPKELDPKDIKTDAERAAEEQRQQRAKEAQMQDEQNKRAQQQGQPRRGDQPVGGQQPRERTSRDGTPDGAGRAYDPQPSGSANVHGKASATRAGGDPAHSPVIGNPGEHNPAAGNYDYGLAGSTRTATEPLRSADVAAPRRAAAEDDGEEEVKYARRVVAFRKGEYGGVKDVGEEFDNTNNLPTYPEDPDSWFQAASEDERKTSEKRAPEMRKKRLQRQQEERDRAERERRR